VAAFVPDKMRAMTMSLMDKNSNNLVRPGNSVDIIATFNNTDTPYTSTILQNVRVAAVNGESQETFVSAGKKAVESVTVLVKPEDAEKLALAKAQASLQIVIRNENDTEEIVTKDSGDAGASSYSGADAARRGDPNRFDSFLNVLPAKDKKIKVIRGTEVQEINVK
jgi:pilus assembly protein CpaB